MTAAAGSSEAIMRSYYYYYRCERHTFYMPSPPLLIEIFSGDAT